MDIVLMGSGNVATHLGRAFKMSGQNILQVWSRDITHAAELADSLASHAISDLDELNMSADLYVISVNDDAISELAGRLKLTDRLVVHTSGSTSMEVLARISSRVGAFYPLQTFSKTKAVDFRRVPIIIEANSAEDATVIRSVAERLSERVLELSSEQRRALHVSAVFACNFTNHLFVLAKQLMDSENMDFDLLRPLIAETADKIQLHDPFDVQTGPAIREDQSTLSAHLKFLQSQPELAELYEKLSQSIVNLHKQPDA